MGYLWVLWNLLWEGAGQVCVKDSVAPAHCRARAEGLSPHPLALWHFSGWLCQFGKAALSHPSLSVTLACGWCPWTGNEVAMRGWVWTPPVEGHAPPPVSDGRCLQPFPLCPEQHFPHACFLLWPTEDLIMLQEWAAVLGTWCFV